MIGTSPCGEEQKLALQNPGQLYSQIFLSQSNFSEKYSVAPSFCIGKLNLIVDWLKAWIMKNIITS